MFNPDKTAKTMPPEIRLCAVGDTHPGRVRETNDDAFLVDEPLGFMAVADGVGRRAGGGVAAQLAVETTRTVLASPLASWSDHAFDEAEDEARARMLSAISRANRRVREEASTRREIANMATTLVVAWVLPKLGCLAVGHVGDSLAFRFRGRRLEKLTPPHRLADDARARACVHPAVLKTLPRNTLTRAIGAKESVEPDVCVVDLLPADIVLLASDGLTDVVPEKESTAVLDDLHDLGAAVNALVDRANGRGGPDNITIALGRWTRG